VKNHLMCHSREGGNPVFIRAWVPAFAGTTRKTTF
jgi:hypothetical protein